jgi:hypothetical protein
LDTRQEWSGILFSLELLSEFQKKMKLLRDLLQIEIDPHNSLDIGCDYSHLSTFNCLTA